MTPIGEPIAAIMPLLLADLGESPFAEHDYRPVRAASALTQDMSQWGRDLIPSGAGLVRSVAPR
jgi:hypothetical protein